MNNAPFIFSNERSWRLKRHLAFWTTWWLTQSVLYSFSPGMLYLSFVQRLEMSSVDAFVYLAPHMFLSYSLMYFVIPRFVVKGKYVQTTLLLISLCLITSGISAFESI